MPSLRARRPAPRSARALRTRHRLVVLAFALVPVLAACGPGDAERRARDPRPNVLVISLDTTRADHLSVYGYGRPTSPRLEALAREGVRFDAAYAPSATTGPTHASLFTGLPPMAHDVRKNGEVLPPALPTLAERLAESGFETGGVVSSFVLSSRFGFDRGFGTWNEDFSKATVPEGITVWEGLEVEGKFYGSAEDTTRRALDWLDRRATPDRPFLLFVHYFDPHDPYTPPPGFEPPFGPGPKVALKQVRTEFLYDVLLAFTDLHVGALLDGLDARALARDTLVVVLGDHGEGLMDHGHPHHGAQIYEEAVRVPLIARWPGRIEAGRVVDRPTSIVDVTADLLTVAGLAPSALEAPAGAPGVLLPDSPAAARPVHLYRRHYEPDQLTPEIFVSGEQFGVRDGRWKLIRAPEEGRLELYDLEVDPEERHDVAATHPDRVAALGAQLDAWIAEADAVRAAWRARAGEAEVARELDPDERARLEALGYVE